MLKVPEFLDDCEKTAILVDGVSNHTLTRTLGWIIDYGRLREYFAKHTHLQKCYYFTPMDEQDQDGLGKLVEWLALNGWQCRLVEYSSEDPRRSPEDRVKKPAIDVEFTVTATAIAEHVDHIILFTGAGKYAPLVKRLDSLGKKVTICSSVIVEPKAVAYDLRKLADHFLELADLKTEIERAPDDRPRRIPEHVTKAIAPRALATARR